MSLVPFEKMINDADAGGYAVGYFESWNLESLLAVADAAEHQWSPVILGFSGICLPDRDRVAADPLSVYAAMGLDTCHKLKVPTCLLFNESPDMKWVHDAVELGFNFVMFSDDQLGEEQLTASIRDLCTAAHTRGVAVEAEMASVPGLSGQKPAVPIEDTMTDAEAACGFAKATNIDALAVNVGQQHLHGRQTVRLDLDRVAQLHDQLDVPLVLHGASSVDRGDLAEAIRLGIRKINVGSIIKQAYFGAMRDASAIVSDDDNPYEIIGSGLHNDVLMAGRLAMQTVTEDLMQLFGSAGRAGSRKRR